MHPYLVALADRRRRRRHALIVYAVMFGAIPLLAGLTDTPSTDDVPLESYAKGEGRPVLLLHGAPGAAGDWSIVWPQVTQEFHAVALDRPGYGHSAAGVFARGLPGNVDAAHRVITEQRLGPTIVAGYSYGTLVAAALALDHPEDVAALVLGSTVFRPHPAPLVFHLFAMPVYGLGLARAFGPFLRWIGPSSRHFEQAKVTQTIAAEALTFDDDLARLAPRLAGLRVPVFVINGGDDPRTPGGDPALPDLPHLQLRVLPGRGHTWIQDAPEVFLEALRDAARATAIPAN